jgi:hypothetical protein
MSDWAEVRSGVLQGSVLGPLIFMLFLNNLPDIIGHSKLNADDNKVISLVDMISGQDQ